MACVVNNSNSLKLIQQVIRYGLVGGGVNLMLYIGYLLVSFAGVDSKTAMSLIYLLGVGIGFIGHRRLTFSHDGDPRRAIMRYIGAHLFGYLLNLVLLIWLVDYLGWRHDLVQGAAILVVAAFLFVTFKYWVFSKHEKYTIK